MARCAPQLNWLLNHARLIGYNSRVVLFRRVYCPVHLCASPDKNMTDKNARSIFKIKANPAYRGWVRLLSVGLLVLVLITGEIFSAMDAHRVSAAPARVVLPMTVIINEVAWAGTAANTNAEWIELYNPGASPILLTGWTLKTTETPAPAINKVLSGTIPAGGYFLLERTSDTTVNDITADLIYTGALANGGGTPELLDATSVLIDTANADGGAWPAGTNTAPTSSCSMERLTGQQDADSAWITNDNTFINGQDASGNPICGTPKSLNWAATFTPTPTPTVSPTVTETLTASITPTPTQTFTQTLTPTITLSPTITITPTQTFTPTVTFTQTPTLLPKSLLINEVAWAGTKNDSSDEWIELYNPSSTNINLSGWTLTIITSSAPIVIPLDGTKTILAGEYYLLEHDEDTTSIASDQLVSNISLNNSGNILLLKDPSTTTIDSANQNQGAWPAGSASPNYCTMERRSATAVDDDNGWLTNNNSVHNAIDSGGNQICGSPKNKNWAYTFIGTPTRTPTKTKTPTKTRTPTRTRTPTKTATPTRSRTPTLAPQTVSQVVINEFLTLPRFDANEDGVIDGGDSFIEIENLSTIPVSVTGWVLDDQDGDSSPYTLPSLTLEPRARQVYFASETHIVLSNAGDSVRLFHGQLISDAFTYPVIRVVGQSWCRLPDGNGTWTFGCEPTPHLVNRLASSVFFNDQPQSKVCLSTTTLAVVYEAECASPGLAIWSPEFWLGDLQKDFPLYIQRQKQVDIIE